MSKRTYTLTPDRKIQLDELAIEGASLSRAAEHLGVDRRTLINAARRANLSDWLKEKFPPKTAFQPPRNTPDHLTRRSANKDQQTLAWRASTQGWRPNTTSKP